MDVSTDLHTLAVEAYTAVLRAFTGTGLDMVCCARSTTSKAVLYTALHRKRSRCLHPCGQNSTWPTRLTTYGVHSPLALASWPVQEILNQVTLDPELQATRYVTRSKHRHMHTPTQGGLRQGWPSRHPVRAHDRITTWLTSPQATRQRDRGTTLQKRAGLHASTVRTHLLCRFVF